MLSGEGQEDPMLTVDDLIAFCGLKAEEVQAIAEHEHLSAGMAAAFGPKRCSRRSVAPSAFGTC